MLKQGQHARIVKITNGLDMQVHYDREVGRYQISPDELERLVMLAAMAGQNPFEQAS